MSVTAMTDNSKERDTILAALRSMGPKFPTTTKLPLSELESRLERALDRAQQYYRYFGSGDRDFKPWSKEHKFSLETAMAPYTITELSRGLSYKSFTVLRLLLSKAIGKPYDKGSQDIAITFLDKDGDRQIKIEVNTVSEISDGVPFISLDYRLSNINLAQAGEKRIPLSPDAFIMIRKILEMNAARLEGGRSISGTETPTSSFLLPLGELDPWTISSLGKNIGCFVCGNANKVRCARCRSVSYCGAECQRLNWNDHKRSCTVLEDGKWITFLYSTKKLDDYGAAAQDIVQSNKDKVPLNFGHGSPKPKSKKKHAQRNVHGDVPFIVKIQPSEIHKGALIVLDRRFNIDGEIFPSDNPETYRLLVDTIRNILLYKFQAGMRIFFWAKYIRRRTLEICIDPIPDWRNIAW